ncbi:MAG: EexN family lipoprotein [Zoogloeaceae bacterium]|nr:EexN family lipoprotein [Zoogloeaceae bacterium]
MKHIRSTPLVATLLPVGLALVLAACEKEVQTVEWYKANDAERMSVIRECKANPDKLNKTQNCINAKQANREILNAGAGR